VLCEAHRCPSLAQNAAAEQIEVHAAVHLALEKLEPGDLAFCRAVVPWLRERCL
jgi:hypothetical protein